MRTRHRTVRVRAPSDRRRSWWSDLTTAAAKAGLRGHRQWGLMKAIEAEGAGKYRRRGLFITRKALARLLELDGREGRPDDVKWGGRNTGRRQHRCQELGLLTLVIGGGRLKGCGSGRWRGRATRIYPGPQVAPAGLVRKQIEADDLAEDATERQIDAPPVSPGQELAEEYRRRGRPPGRDPP